MPALEKRTLALLAEAINRDQGGTTAVGDAWLQDLLDRRLAVMTADAKIPRPVSLVEGEMADDADLGVRLRSRIEGEAFSLLCGTDAADRADRVALGLDPTAVISAINLAMIGGLGVAPPLAVVITALLLRRLAEPTIDEFCARWRRERDPAAVPRK